MSNIEIIGLSGKAGSGKDYLGKKLLRPLGYFQYSFAWPMKNEAVGGVESNGQILYPSYEDVHFIKPPEVRQFLQVRGTELGWMKYGKPYWCKIAGAWLRTFAEQWNIRRFYIPDTRFVHEVEWIHEMGGKVFRITGRGGLPGLAGQHLSETALDDYTDFDGYIDNSPDRHLNEVRAELLRGLGVLDTWAAPWEPAEWAS